MSQTYAEKLRAMRTGARWSRPKMVERVGVPLRTIEDWEAGMATPPEYVQQLVLDRLQVEIEQDDVGIEHSTLCQIRCEECGNDIYCLPSVKEHLTSCPICKADL